MRRAASSSALQTNIKLAKDTRSHEAHNQILLDTMTREAGSMSIGQAERLVGKMTRMEAQHDALSTYITTNYARIGAAGIVRLAAALRPVYADAYREALASARNLDVHASNVVTARAFFGYYEFNNPGMNADARKLNVAADTLRGQARSHKPAVDLQVDAAHDRLLTLVVKGSGFNAADYMTLAKAARTASTRQFLEARVVGAAKASAPVGM